MINQSASAAHAAFTRALSTAVLAGIGRRSDSQWKIDEEAVAAFEEVSTEDLRVQLSLQGALQGSLLLEIAQPDAAMISALLGGEASAGSKDDENGTLLQCIDEAVREFASSSAATYGTFTIEADLAEEPSPSLPADVERICRFTATDGVEGQFRFVVRLSAELMKALNAVSSLASDTLPGATARREPVNLDLVLDVELNVTLRFGQRILTLREVLDLTSGSVIELDRQVEEPIELLLEGKLIARGEAVVVDGNYGLRITEVPQPISSQMLI